MAISLTQLDTDLAGLMADWSDTVTIGADADVPCCRIQLRPSDLRALKAEVREHYEETIAVQKSAFTTVPTVGGKATRGTTVRRILGVPEMAGGLELRLHLGTEY